MKIVFMGTPQFAVPSLEKIHAEHEIVAVITAPDKPAGRGKRLSESAVKKAAIAMGLPVMQPTNLKDEDFQAELKSLGGEVFVVVAFRMLPDAVWQIPPKGTINLHASLLPQYRGAAPINRAIMNGETTTGLTTFFIKREIDTGAIIQQVRMEIGADETAGELHDRMMVEGASLLLSTLEDLKRGEVEPIAQETLYEGGEIKQAPKLFREDREIDWNRPDREVHNQIRGLSPYPGAFAVTRDGKEVKILLTAMVDDRGMNGEGPGAVHFEEDRVFVQTQTRPLEILRMQMPGKRAMDTPEILRGLRNREELDFSRG